MYTSNSFTSDLVNSYAWDTAILFIQTFSDNKNYANQNSLNKSLAKTGVNGDEKCHIQDMASNTKEWTTETNTSFLGTACTRGGTYDNSYYSASDRTGYSISDTYAYIAFRPLLYL